MQTISRALRSANDNQSIYDGPVHYFI